MEDALLVVTRLSSAMKAVFRWSKPLLKLFGTVRIIRMITVVRALRRSRPILVVIAAIDSIVITLLKSSLTIGFANVPFLANLNVHMVRLGTLSLSFVVVVIAMCYSLTFGRNLGNDKDRDRNATIDDLKHEQRRFEEKILSNPRSHGQLQEQLLRVTQMAIASRNNLDAYIPPVIHSPRKLELVLSHLGRASAQRDRFQSKSSNEELHVRSDRIQRKGYSRRVRNKSTRKISRPSNKKYRSTPEEQKTPDDEIPNHTVTKISPERSKHIGGESFQDCMSIDESIVSDLSSNMEEGDEEEFDWASAPAGKSKRPFEEGEERNHTDHKRKRQKTLSGQF